MLYIYISYQTLFNKNRFDIEQMFKDFKSASFNLSNNIHYSKMLYFCVCITYNYLISLDIFYSKDKRTSY